MTVVECLRRWHVPAPVVIPRPDMAGEESPGAPLTGEDPPTSTPTTSDAHTAATKQYVFCVKYVTRGDEVDREMFSTAELANEAVQQWMQEKYDNNLAWYKSSKYVKIEVDKSTCSVCHESIRVKPLCLTKHTRKRKYRGEIGSTKSVMSLNTFVREYETARIHAETPTLLWRKGVGDYVTARQAYIMLCLTRHFGTDERMRNALRDFDMVNKEMAGWYTITRRRLDCKKSFKSLTERADSDEGSDVEVIGGEGPSDSD